MHNTNAPIAIASHQRSGTHLLIDLIRRQFPTTRSWKWPTEKLNALYLNLERLRPEHCWSINVRQAQRLNQRAKRPILKTHSTAELNLWTGPANNYVTQLTKEATWLYVYRDPRSVMCSYHLLMQISDPNTRVLLKDFIRQPHDGTDVSRVRFWSDHVCSWLNFPDITAFNFTEVIRNT